MFGNDAKMGLTLSPLPQEILSTLSTEEDLVAHLGNKQTQDPTLHISSVHITSFYTPLRLWMSWFTVDNTVFRPQIFQLFDYISSEFPTVVWKLKEANVLGLFKESREECQLKKRKVASKGLVVKPLLSTL
jgi:hypothetical protein